IPNVAKASKNGFQRERLARPRRALRADPQRRKHGYSAGGKRCGVYRRGPAEKSIEQSTDRGAENCGTLKNAGIPGYRALELFFGNELRQKGPAGRHTEAAHGPHKRENRKDRSNRSRAVERLRPQAHDQEERRGKRVAAIAKRQKFPPVKPVGHMAG